jgi:hypothetical protein
MSIGFHEQFLPGSIPAQAPFFITSPVYNTPPLSQGAAQRSEAAAKPLPLAEAAAVLSGFGVMKKEKKVVSGEAGFRGRVSANFRSEVGPPNLCQEYEQRPSAFSQESCSKGKQEFCGTWTKEELPLQASPLSTVLRFRGDRKLLTNH